MTISPRLLGCFVVACALQPVACNRDAPSSAPAPLTSQPGPSNATSEPTPSAPPPRPAKIDPTDPASLKEGLDAMAPRLVAQVDAYKKIAPDERNRYFMHPDENKNASIEFNTKGLTSLTLSPFIGDFTYTPDCVDNPKAGIVQLTWSVDGGRKTRLTVDRNYVGTVSVDVSKSSRLKLEVDKGNDVTWCDWFSVGFLNVK